MNSINWSSSRALAKKEQMDRLSTIIPQLTHTGITLDVGCGQMPYRQFVQSTYIGLDKNAGEIWASAQALPIKNNTITTVICTQVLEHLPSPQTFFSEVHRVLKTNGQVIITTPMTWPLHEEPRDFWRFTEHGLRELCTQSNLTVTKIQPLGGYFGAIWQLFAVLLERPAYYPGLIRWLYRNLLKIVFYTVQPLIYYLDQKTRTKKLTISYLLIAKKS